MENQKRKAEFDSENVSKSVKLNEDLPQVSMGEIMPQLDLVMNELDNMGNEREAMIQAVRKQFSLKENQLYMKRDALLRQLKCFWLTVFTNVPEISELMTDLDDIILSVMDSFRVEHKSDSCIILHFHFRSNDLFSNTDMQIVIDHIVNDSDVIDVDAQEHDSYSVKFDSFSWKHTRVSNEESFFSDLFSQKDLVLSLLEILIQEIWMDPVTIALSGPLE